MHAPMGPPAKTSGSDSKTDHQSREKERDPHSSENGCKPVETNFGRKSLEKFCLETGDTKAAKPSGNLANSFKGTSSSTGFGWRFSNSRESIHEPALNQSNISLQAKTKNQKSISLAVPGPASTALTNPIDPTSKNSGCDDDSAKPDRESIEKESDGKKRNDDHKPLAKCHLKPGKIHMQFQSDTAAKSISKIGVSKPAITFAFTGYTCADSKIAESKAGLTDASVPSAAANGNGSTTSHQDHQSYKKIPAAPTTSFVDW
jgi:hypothetical protein